MRGYPCQSCGRVFDPEKSDICPACGAAVSPAVLTRIERKKTARWLRAEGQTHYDEHCHEDDSWAGSYGAESHRAAVQSHESALRSNYAAHTPVDHPSLRSGDASRPAEAFTTPSQRNAKQSEKKSPAPLLIFLILLVLYLLTMIVPEVVKNFKEFGIPGFEFP